MFSDNRIQSLLRGRFVCARLNLEGDKTAGGSFAHTPRSPAGFVSRGLGEHNVQLLMLTPRGNLLNIVSGYIDANGLVRELKRALDIWKRVKASKTAKAKKAIIRAAHERALAEIERRPPGPLQRALGGRPNAKEKRKRKKRDQRVPTIVIGAGRDAVDHRFARDNPLLNAKQFKPEKLVGAGGSFFGSSNGRRPEEEIGTGRRRGQ